MASSLYPYFIIINNYYVYVTVIRLCVYVWPKIETVYSLYAYANVSSWISELNVVKKFGVMRTWLVTQLHSKYLFLFIWYTRSDQYWLLMLLNSQKIHADKSRDWWTWVCCIITQLFKEFSKIISAKNECQRTQILYVFTVTFYE